MKAIWIVCVMGSVGCGATGSAVQPTEGSSHGHGHDHDHAHDHGHADGHGHGHEAPADDPISQEIARYQEKLEANPNLYPIWAKLGEAYLRRARTLGRHDDYDLAAKALEQSLSIQENQEAMRWLAGVRLDQHAFAEAAEIAKRALSAWEQDGIARAVLADAYLAMGRYDDARQILEPSAKKGEDFYSMAGYSRLLFLTGKIDEAVKQLERARKLLEDAPVEAGDQRAVDDARAWSLVMSGSYLMESGQVDEARHRLDEALAIRPASPAAVLHRARWEAQHGDRAQAAEMYEGLANRRHGTLEMIELGQLLLKMDRPEEGNRWLDAAEAHLREHVTEGDTAHRRELIMLLLDRGKDLPLALEMAQKELESRQDPLAYDALAWALHKNGLQAEARAALKKALRFGTRTSELERHRKAILGDEPDAG